MNNLSPLALVSWQLCFNFGLDNEIIFTDAERVTLIESVYDADPDQNPNAVLTKNRAHQVLWRVLNLGISVSDVEDKIKSKDVRKTATFSRALIVRKKL